MANLNKSKMAEEKTCHSTQNYVPRYQQWQEQRQQAAEAAAYKKNPDLFHNKMESMEAARLRLQARRVSLSP